MFHYELVYRGKIFLCGFLFPFSTSYLKIVCRIHPWSIWCWSCLAMGNTLSWWTCLSTSYTSCVVYTSEYCHGNRTVACYVPCPSATALRSSDSLRHSAGWWFFFHTYMANMHVHACAFTCIQVDVYRRKRDQLTHVGKYFCENSAWDDCFTAHILKKNNLWFVKKKFIQSLERKLRWIIMPWIWI